MSTIVIFDSGVGGLSIYQEIIKKCPDHRYVFVSDNQAFPYGTKTEDELIARVTKVVAQINQEYSPDILVVACNTASTVVLPTLREQYDFPIVGVVPAIKPAASLTQNKTIGLLATPGTIKRSYTQQLIDDFAPDCTVVKVGSSELVQIAEDKLCGKPVDINRIKHIMQPFLDNDKLDVLVLACTHFPLLNNELKLVFKLKNRSINMKDSGQAIANRVDSLLSKSETSNYSATAAFTQKNNSNMLSESLTKMGFTEIVALNINGERLI